MRILHTDKYLHRKGGATGYMLDLAELQRRRGDVVEFFAMDDPERNPEATYQDQFPSYIEFEPAPPGLRARAAGFGRMVWSTSARRGMAQVLEDFRPDVVHLHTIYHQLSPSILAPMRRRHVPVVMTVHDHKLVCPSYSRLDHGSPCDACLNGTLLEAVKRRCKDDSLAASAALMVETGLHRALRAYDPISVFICPSHFVADSMAQAGVFTDRVRHLPHFFDASTLPAREGPGEGIVAAGRLSMEKGFDLLVDAMSALPDAKLRIVGDGPEDDALRAQAARVAPDRIHFTGRLPKEGVLAELRAARVAVIPSRWYENQPLAVIEAMGSGVAPVVTDLGGSPEMVDHGVEGWIARPDSASLAEALRAPLADPDLAVTAGRAARARIERDFDPDRHLVGVDDAYATAMATTR